MLHLYQNDERRSTAKNHCHPASLLSLDSKIFEKLSNNRHVNHIRKCSFYSKFQYGFRYSQSTADLLPDTSNTLIDFGLLIGLGLLSLLHLICPRFSAGLPHKLKSYGILRPSIWPYFKFSR